MKILYYNAPPYEGPMYAKIGEQYLMEGTINKNKHLTTIYHWKPIEPYELGNVLFDIENWYTYDLENGQVKLKVIYLFGDELLRKYGAI